MNKGIFDDIILMVICSVICGGFTIFLSVFLPDTKNYRLKKIIKEQEALIYDLRSENIELKGVISNE